MVSYLIASINLLIVDTLDNHHWHVIVLGLNDKMLMEVSMSLEMCMQCGPSHVKCGCNVDPPHLHILKVDVMWSNVDVLWSSVDFHISNVNKCKYIVGQHNGNLR